MKIREYLDNYQKKMHIPAGYTYPENGDYGFCRENEGGEIFYVYHDTGALPEDEHVTVDYSDPVLDEEWIWSVSSAAAALGRLGGKAKTDAKRKASAENGKKGGRPKLELTFEEDDRGGRYSWTYKGKSYETNWYSEGMFWIDPKTGNRHQMVGTLDFNLKGTTKDSARAKIRRYLVNMEE